MTELGSSQRENEDTIEQGATPLELFFDLVFVFAFTQVTSFLSDHLTWTGMLQGAALLAALWWAWICYSWLTNAVPAEEALSARLVILSAMAAMLVVSLAVPDAFGDSQTSEIGSFRLFRRLLRLLIEADRGFSDSFRRLIPGNPYSAGRILMR